MVWIFRTLLVMSVILSARLGQAADDRPRQKVAIFGLRASGLDEGQRSSLLGVLAEEVARVSWLQVVSGDDIAAMLDAEAQKQLMGCDDTGCLAEIAGALDVDLVIAGSVAFLGDGVVVSLQLINQRFANVMNRASLTWRGEPSRLAEVMRAAAQLLVLEAADRPPVRVRVLELPKGAQVFVDGQERGQADARGRVEIEAVEVGVHQLAISAGGFSSRELYFVSRVGHDLKIRGALEPLPFYATWWFWTASGVLATLTAAAVVAVVSVNTQVGTVSISGQPSVAGSLRP